MGGMTDHGEIAVTSSHSDGGFNLQGVTDPFGDSVESYVLENAGTNTGGPAV